MAGGLLIAIEGIDGAGKTTLARSLTAWLQGMGHAVSASKEPTHGQWGRQLRESAATGRLSVQDEVELLIKDRQEHVTFFIRPALDRDEIVILDRYFPSMVAYQGAAGVAMGDLMAANEFAPRPDVLLLLDLDPSIGLARIRARGDVPNHFESEGNLADCRAIFLDLGIQDTQVIDASLGEAEVLAQAQLAVYRAMAKKVAASDGVTAEAVQRLSSMMPKQFVSAG